jgi:hypothetical protein
MAYHHQHQYKTMDERRMGSRRICVSRPRYVFFTSLFTTPNYSYLQLDHMYRNHDDDKWARRQRRPRKANGTSDASASSPRYLFLLFFFILVTFFNIWKITTYNHLISLANTRWGWVLAVWQRNQKTAQDMSLISDRKFFFSYSFIFFTNNILK